MSNSFDIDVKPEIATNLAQIISSTTALTTILTDNFLAVNTNINDNETKIDTLIARTYVQSLEYWSLPSQITIDLTTTPGDKNFNDIVVIGIPATATILYVQLILNCPILYSSHATLPNKLSASQKIRIKKSTGAWDVDDIDGISFEDDDLFFREPVSSSGCNYIHGNVDVKSVVDEDATYNVQLEDGVSAEDHFYLASSQVGLKIFFTS